MLPEPATRVVAAFDETTERAIDALRSPAADRVFYALSSACDHGILWHTIGALRALRRGTVRDAAAFSTAMAIESFVTNVGVKSLFGRRRPAESESTEPLLYDLHRPITSSFPSGHATAAFCAAALLVRDGRSRVAWYGLATLVATSRVYVRLHHPSDVVAGAVLGRALGGLLAPIVPARPGIRRGGFGFASKRAREGNR